MVSIVVVVCEDVNDLTITLVVGTAGGEKRADDDDDDDGVGRGGFPKTSLVD